jgi:hypothetical protein
MLSCLAEELGCDQLLGEELGRLKRLARATPGFLASDLALLLSRIVSSYASSSFAAALQQPGRKKRAGNFGIEKNGGKFGIEKNGGKKFFRYTVDWRKHLKTGGGGGVGV